MTGTTRLDQVTWWVLLLVLLLGCFWFAVWPTPVSITCLAIDVACLTGHTWRATR